MIPGRGRIEGRVWLDERGPAKEWLRLAAPLLEELDWPPSGPGGRMQLLSKLRGLGEVVELVANSVRLLDVAVAGGVQILEEFVVRDPPRDLLAQPEAVETIALPRRREVHLSDGLGNVAGFA